MTRSKITIAAILSLAILCLAIAACAMISTARLQTATIFPDGVPIEIEQQSPGGTIINRVINAEQTEQLKSLLNLDARSWTRSLVSYVPTHRLTIGRTTIVIHDQILIVNTDVQVVASIRKDEADAIVNLIHSLPLK